MTATPARISASSTASTGTSRARTCGVSSNDANLRGGKRMTDLNFSRRGIMGALIAAGAVGAIDLGLPSALFAADLKGADIDAAVKAAYDKYRGLNEGKNA